MTTNRLPSSLEVVSALVTLMKVRLRRNQILLRLRSTMNPCVSSSQAPRAFQERIAWEACTTLAEHDLEREARRLRRVCVWRSTRNKAILGVPADHQLSVRAENTESLA